MGQGQGDGRRWDLPSADRQVPRDQPEDGQAVGGVEAAAELPTSTFGLDPRPARAGDRQADRRVARDQVSAGHRDPPRLPRLRGLRRFGPKADRCDAAARRAPRAEDRLPPRAGDADRLGRDADPAEDHGQGAPHLRPRLLAALLGRGDRPLLLGHDQRVLPRGPRSRLRLARRRPARVRLRQPALGGRPPRGRSDHLEPALSRAARPLRLPRHRLHSGDSAGEGRGRGSGPPHKARLLARPQLRLAGRARPPIRRLA